MFERKKLLSFEKQIYYLFYFPNYLSILNLKYLGGNHSALPQVYRGLAPTAYLNSIPL
jgi:hypothetical protein